MMRKAFTAVILLLLLTAFAAQCTAERTPATPTDLKPAHEQTPATPTDLECLHEHTGSIIYFFDSPSYTSLSAVSHRVSGPGVLQVVCRDCGKTLSEEAVDSAEEIRPHSMKKGVCALCGYHQNTAVKMDRKDEPGERTLIAQPDGNDLFFLTLTEQDLIALENAKVRILVVRGEYGRAVIAVNVREIRQETGREAASFSIEMSEKDDGSMFAGLSLSSVPGRKEELDIEGVTLRFYEDREPALKIALDPTNGDKLTETEAVWDENGYWTVPYVSEGNYLVVRESN